MSLFKKCMHGTGPVVGSSIRRFCYSVVVPGSKAGSKAQHSLQWQIAKSTVVIFNMQDACLSVSEQRHAKTMLKEHSQASLTGPVGPAMADL